MRYYGKIGFEVTKETRPGIWEATTEFREYYGEVHRWIKRYENSDHQNDDIDINNSISIISDPFANENLGNLKCIEWMGTLWKITSIEVEYPRLILTIGGVYTNGE